MRQLFKENNIFSVLKLFNTLSVFAHNVFKELIHLAQLGFSQLVHGNIMIYNL